MLKIWGTTLTTKFINRVRRSGVFIIKYNQLK